MQELFVAKKPRIRLGAEELLELGRRQFVGNPSNRPYLAGRPKKIDLGILDILGSIAGFLADGLAFAFNTLGDLIDVPLQILSQGVDIAFNGVAGLLGEIPIVGDLLAQIVLLGGSLIKFGLSIPGLVLHGLGNVLGGIGKALAGSGSAEENQDKVDSAKEEITAKAPDHLKENVKAILDASGVTGRNLTPNVSSDGKVTTTPADTAAAKRAAETGVVESEIDLGKALAIGVPAVGAVVLLVVLAT